MSKSKSHTMPADEMMMWTFYIFLGAPFMFLVGTLAWAGFCHVRHVSMDSQPPNSGFIFAAAFILIPPLIRAVVIFIHWMATLDE